MLNVRKEYCKRVCKKYSTERERLDRIKKEEGFYCKQCDAAYTSNYALMQHTFTLKHQRNRGNYDAYKKAKLIGARDLDRTRGRT